MVLKPHDSLRRRHSTSDLRPPSPIKIPRRTTNFHTLLRFWNEKESASIAQWDGAFPSQRPPQPVWLPLPGNTVKSRTLSYPSDHTNTKIVPGSQSGPSMHLRRVKSTQFGPRAVQGARAEPATDPVEDITVAGGDRREMAYRRGSELQSVKVWREVRRSESLSGDWRDPRKQRRRRGSRRSSAAQNTSTAAADSEIPNLPERCRRSSISQLDGGRDGTREHEIDGVVLRRRRERQSPAGRTRSSSRERRIYPAGTNTPQSHLRHHGLHVQLPGTREDKTPLERESGEQHRVTWKDDPAIRRIKSYDRMAKQKGYRERIRDVDHMEREKQRIPQQTDPRRRSVPAAVSPPGPPPAARKSTFWGKKLQAFKEYFLGKPDSAAASSSQSSVSPQADGLPAAATNLTAAQEAALVGPPPQDVWGIISTTQVLPTRLPAHTAIEPSSLRRTLCTLEPAGDSEEYITARAFTSRPSTADTVALPPGIRRASADAASHSSDSGAMYTPRMRKARTFKSIARERQTARRGSSHLLIAVNDHVPKVPSQVNVTIEDVGPVSHTSIASVSGGSGSTALGPADVLQLRRPSLADAYPLSSQETVTSFSMRSAGDDSSDSVFTFTGDNVVDHVHDEPATPLSAASSGKLSRIGRPRCPRASPPPPPPPPPPVPKPFRSPTLLRELGASALPMRAAPAAEPAPGDDKRVTHKRGPRLVQVRPGVVLGVGSWVESQNWRPGSALSESSSSSQERGHHEAALQGHRERMESRSSLRAGRARTPEPMSPRAAGAGAGEDGPDDRDGGVSERPRDGERGTCFE